MKRLLRITSHSGHARYLHTVTDAGWIVRQPIPSPYRFGPSHAVYTDPTRGAVIIVETSHKRYDVFAVPAELTIYTTDDQATDAYMRILKAGRSDAPALARFVEGR